MFLLFTRNTCNKRFATFEFQRDEKTESGKEIYLWYDNISGRTTEKTEKWRLSSGSNFQARNNKCYMKLSSQGKQEFLIHLQRILQWDIIHEKSIISITNILEHDVKKLGNNWREKTGYQKWKDKATSAATVTISWNSHSLKYSFESIKIVL